MLQARQGIQISNPLSEIDFPRFDGSHLRSWILKCEVFFKLFPHIPDHKRIELATAYSQGRAAQWFQTFDEKQVEFTWDQFLQITCARFENIRETMLFAEFNKLKQTGTYVEYAEKFNELLARVLMLNPKDCSEDYLVEKFMSGLSKELQEYIGMFEPKTLQQHVGVGRLITEKIIPNCLSDIERKTKSLPSSYSSSTHPKSTHTSSQTTNTKLKNEIPSSYTPSNTTNTSSLLCLHEKSDKDEPEALNAHNLLDESLLVLKSLGVNPKRSKLDNEAEVEKLEAEPIREDSSKGLKIDDEVAVKKSEAEPFREESTVEEQCVELDCASVEIKNQSIDKNNLNGVPLLNIDNEQLTRPTEFVKKRGMQEASNVVNVRTDPSSHPLVAFSLDPDMDQFARTTEFVKDRGKQVANKPINKYFAPEPVAWNRWALNLDIMRCSPRIKGSKLLEYHGQLRNNETTEIKKQELGNRILKHENLAWCRRIALGSAVLKLDGCGEERWLRRNGFGPKLGQIDHGLEWVWPNLAQRNRGGRRESWSRRFWKAQRCPKYRRVPFREIITRRQNKSKRRDAWFASIGKVRWLEGDRSEYNPGLVSPNFKARRWALVAQDTKTQAFEFEGWDTMSKDFVLVTRDDVDVAGSGSANIGERRESWSRRIAKGDGRDRPELHEELVAFRSWVLTDRNMKSNFEGHSNWNQQIANCFGRWKFLWNFWSFWFFGAMRRRISLTLPQLGLFAYVLLCLGHIYFLGLVL